MIITNDGSNEAEVVNATDQTACAAILRDLSADCPSATFIIAVRPFDGTQASNIQAACGQRTYFPDTTDWHNAADGSLARGQGPHLRVDDRQILSPRTAAAARLALIECRSTVFSNVGGSAVPANRACL